jgi:hypothetical protein
MVGNFLGLVNQFFDAFEDALNRCVAFLRLCRVLRFIESKYRGG